MAITVKKENRKTRRVEKTVRGEEWEVVGGDSLPPDLREILAQMDPKQVSLFTVWAINGRNISAAARQAGYNESHARRLFSMDTLFLAARRWVETALYEEDLQWTELLPRARRTLRDLLTSKDEKVRFMAAKDIADRAEGKASVRVDMTITEHRPSLTEGEVQLAISLVQQADMGFAEARQWIYDNPEQVQAWISQNVSQQKGLPPGRQIEEAVVISEALSGGSGGASTGPARERASSIGSSGPALRSPAPAAASSGTKGPRPSLVARRTETLLK
jgi:hypothetical protein